MDVVTLGTGAGVTVILLGIIFAFLIKMKWLTASNNNSQLSKIEYIFPQEIKDKISNIEKDTSKINGKAV